MAVPAFHFSGVYKEQLLQKEKTATLMLGEYSFPIGSNVLVYISETPNLFDENPREKRYGGAIIIKSSVLKLSAVDNNIAIKCGYKDSL